jgi:hypothetical protein
MAKLDTTIDNLERKSNKVLGTVPSPDWTDAQYPSAKTLYNTYNNLLDLMHPVGSILTTTSNKSPASTLGGEWSLVDKAFKATYLTLNSSHWTNTTASLGDYSNILLNDHTIAFRLNFKTTAAISDETATLGTLALPLCGVNQLSYAVFYHTAISDGGNCVMACRMDQAGVISLHEVINVDGSHSMVSGADFFIHLVVPVRYTDMLDDFCDKFYWKRTA